MVNEPLSKLKATVHTPSKRTFHAHESTAETWEYICNIHQRQRFSGLITGISGVGKSFLAKEYARSFPRVELEDKTLIPVLYVKLGATSTPTDLLHQILNALGCKPMASNEKPLTALNRLIYLLEALRVELILIDEVQECLPDTDGIRAQRMAKQFAELIDKTEIPILMLGTPVAKRIIELKYKGGDSEEQLSRRLVASRRLCPCPPQCQDWLDLVNFYQRKFGFSELTKQLNEDLLNRLFIATKGTHGLLEKLYFHMMPGRYSNSAQYMMAFEEAYRLAINNSPQNTFTANSESAIQIERNTEALEKEMEEAYANE